VSLVVICCCKSCRVIVWRTHCYGSARGHAARGMGRSVDRDPNPGAWMASKSNRVATVTRGATSRGAVSADGPGGPALLFKEGADPPWYACGTAMRVKVRRVKEVLCERVRGTKSLFFSVFPWCCESEVGSGCVMAPLVTRAMEVSGTVVEWTGGAIVFVFVCDHVFCESKGTCVCAFAGIKIRALSVLWAARFFASCCFFFSRVRAERAGTARKRVKPSCASQETVW
jgi:hypothetical protein